MWKCINADGQEVNVGDAVKDSRGRVDVVRSLEPPHKIGSTGRIYCEKTLGGRFAKVYDCKFVQVDKE